MKPLCEIVVGQVLPTIRAMVVRDLTKRYKMSQVEVARKLGITQPAVSQYVSSLRGKEDTEKILAKIVDKEIKSLSDDIASGKLRQEEVINKYCEICKLLKKKGVLGNFQCEILKL